VSEAVGQQSAGCGFVHSSNGPCCGVTAASGCARSLCRPFLGFRARMELQSPSSHGGWLSDLQMIWCGQVVSVSEVGEPKNGVNPVGSLIRIGGSNCWLSVEAAMAVSRGAAKTSGPRTHS